MLPYLHSQAPDLCCRASAFQMSDLAPNAWIKENLVTIDLLEVFDVHRPDPFPISFPFAQAAAIRMPFLRLLSPLRVPIWSRVFLTSGNVFPDKLQN